LTSKAKAAPKSQAKSKGKAATQTIEENPWKALASIKSDDLEEEQDELDMLSQDQSDYDWEELAS
jgi:hypothetical protein